jgi:hypothetical protein
MRSASAPQGGDCGSVTTGSVPISGRGAYPPDVCSAAGLIASDGVTTGTDGNDDYWRRPAGTSGGFGPPPEVPDQQSAAPDQRSGPAGYVGPPPTAPPPPDWRPEVVSPSPPPRRLPDQDLDALDSDERSARTLTYGIAMIAGAVLVVLSCLLCSRVLL